MIEAGWNDYQADCNGGVCQHSSLFFRLLFLRVSPPFPNPPAFCEASGALPYWLQMALAGE
ncbi:MAG: hypothetical protein ACOCUT_01795 [bacterium]